MRKGLLKIFFLYRYGFSPDTPVSSIVLKICMTGDSNDQWDRSRPWSKNRERRDGGTLAFHFKWCPLSRKRDPREWCILQKGGTPVSYLGHPFRKEIGCGYLPFTTKEDRFIFHRKTEERAFISLSFSSYMACKLVSLKWIVGLKLTKKKSSRHKRRPVKALGAWCSNLSITSLNQFLWPQQTRQILYFTDRKKYFQIPELTWVSVLSETDYVFHYFEISADLSNHLIRFIKLHKWMLSELRLNYWFWSRIVCRCLWDLCWTEDIVNLPIMKYDITDIIKLSPQHKSSSSDEIMRLLSFFLLGSKFC